MQYKILILLILCTQFILGQQHSKSIGFSSDNDFYISTALDQYYTNGLTLSYQFLPKKISKRLLKKIYTLQFGQYIYAPFRANVPKIEDQDRPFAGYLFANIEIANYYKSNNFLKFTYQIGVLGPSSQAGTIQKWFHKTFGFDKVAGWEFQIQNQIGININALYVQNINYFNNNKIDINMIGQAKIGTINNEFSAGFISRIGFRPLHEVSNTIVFNSNIGSKNLNVKEFYLYVKPQLTYTVHNSTLEGGIFSNRSSLTFNAAPIKSSIELGLMRASQHFNLGYSISYLSQSIQNNRDTSHCYGTIDFVYLLN